MAAKASRPSVGRFVVSSIGIVLFFPSLTLALAGDWRWIEGWVFALWMDAMALSNYAYLYLHDPELLAERSKAPGADDQKKWDKYILSGAYVMAFLWLIIMPLDAKRFGWSPAFPVWLEAVGGLALLPALYLIYRATVENTFLSTRVRIQAERKQRVIATGVYGFVRHPLYLGVLLMMFGSPLLLGSVVGLLISVVAAAVLVGRIIGEERMLVDELEGYEDYRIKVRYRLLPLIW